MSTKTINASQQSVGVIKEINKGEIYALNKEGHLRKLTVGSKIMADDQLQVNENSVVKIVLSNGKTILIPEDFYKHFLNAAEGNEEGESFSLDGINISMNNVHLTGDEGEEIEEEELKEVKRHHEEDHHHRHDHLAPLKNDSHPNYELMTSFPRGFINPGYDTARPLNNDFRKIENEFYHHKETLVVSLTGGNTVIEGFLIPFHLSLNSISDVNVNVTLNFGNAGDSATSGIDYNNINFYDINGMVLGTGNVITIPAGEEGIDIYVKTTDDNITEFLENLTINIVDVENAEESNQFEDPIIDPVNYIAEGFIIDNDFSTVSLTGGNTVDEGNRVPFTLLLDKVSDADIQVTLSFGDAGDSANAGIDYNNLMFFDINGNIIGTGNTIIIPAGQQSIDLYVQTLDDNITEFKESFTLKIASVENVSGNDSIQDPQISAVENSAKGFILDNDCSYVSLTGGGTVTEGEIVPFTLSLDKISDAPVLVTLSFGDASDTATAVLDYEISFVDAQGSPLGNANTLTIPAGVQSINFFVKTNDDDHTEFKETFTLKISSVNNITSDNTICEAKIHPTDNTSTTHIVDNDCSKVSILGGGFVNEGDRLKFTLSLDHTSDADIKVTIQFGEAGDSATPGNDYANIFFVDVNGNPIGSDNTITIPAGHQTYDIYVQTLDDSKAEFTEKFTLKITDAVNANTEDTSICPAQVDTEHDTAQGFIKDSDCPIFSIEGCDKVTEGGLAEFTINLSAPSDADTKVKLKIGLDGDSANAGTDFDDVKLYDENGNVISNSPCITVPAGQTSLTFYIQTLDDECPELKENFTVKIWELHAEGCICQGKIDCEHDSAKAWIIDNDPPVCSTLSILGGGFVNEGDKLKFTLSLDHTSSTDIKVTLQFGLGSDSTTSGVDYSNLSFFDVNGNAIGSGNEIIIPAGHQTQDIYVKTINDNITEFTEEFTIKIVDAVNICNDNDHNHGDHHDKDHYKNHDKKYGKGHDNDHDRDHDDKHNKNHDKKHGKGHDNDRDRDHDDKHDKNHDKKHGKGHDNDHDRDHDHKHDKNYDKKHGKGHDNDHDRDHDDKHGKNHHEKNEHGKSDCGELVCPVKIDCEHDTATGFIKDNDCPIVSIVGCDTVTEGGLAQFTLNLSAPSDADTQVTLKLGLPGDSAQGGSDFNNVKLYDVNGNVISNSPTITVPAGQTSVSFYIQTIDDNHPELKENFSVKIWELQAVDCICPGKIDCEHDKAEAKIIDNDRPVCSIVSLLGGGFVNEGDQLKFTLSLDHTSPTDIKVTLQFGNGSDSATSGVDYNNLNFFDVNGNAIGSGNQIIIPAGHQTFDIYVKTTDDNITEFTEKFTIKITDAQNINCENQVICEAKVDCEHDTATGFIKDNDCPIVSIVGCDTVTEGGLAQFTLNLSAPSDADTQVTLKLGLPGDSAQAGSDFNNVKLYDVNGNVISNSPTITVPAGQTSISFYIQTIDDNHPELKENFSVKIWELQAVDCICPGKIDCEHDKAEAKIIDNDKQICPALSIQGCDEVTEGGLAKFTLSLTKANDVDVKVDLKISANGDSATAGADYDNVKLYDVNGNVISNSPCITIPAGQTSLSFYIQTIDDQHVELKEKFSIKIDELKSDDCSCPAKIDHQNDKAEAKITDNDRPVCSIVSLLGGGFVNEGDQLKFTLSLDHTSPTDIKVTLQIGHGADTATSGVDYSNLNFFDVNGNAIGSGNQIIIPAGHQTFDIYIKTIDDNISEFTEKFTIKITDAQNINCENQVICEAKVDCEHDTATGFIKDNDCPIVSIVGCDTVTEGGLVQFTLNLSAPSDGDTKVILKLGLPGDKAEGNSDFNNVKLYDANGNVISNSPCITIPAGETSITFYIQTLDDKCPELKENFSVKIWELQSEHCTCAAKIDCENDLAKAWIKDNDKKDHHEKDDDKDCDKDKHDHKDHGKNDKDEDCDKDDHKNGKDKDHDKDHHKNDKDKNHDKDHHKNHKDKDHDKDDHKNHKDKDHDKDDHKNDKNNEHDKDDHRDANYHDQNQDQNHEHKVIMAKDLFSDHGNSIPGLDSNHKVDQSNEKIDQSKVNKLGSHSENANEVLLKVIHDGQHFESATLTHAPVNDSNITNHNSVHEEVAIS